MKAKVGHVIARRLDRSRVSRHSHRYVFCEKASGGAYFHSEIDGREGFPSDKAASLLAMHCMVRGLSPQDFDVFVPLEGRKLKSLYEKTSRLLLAGRAVHTTIKLTRREEEVLRALTSNLTNKEIAAALHLTERTVKFHVSSLLSKFRVRNRLNLSSESWRYTCSEREELTPGAPQIGRQDSQSAARQGKGSHVRGSATINEAGNGEFRAI